MMHNLNPLVAPAALITCLVLCTTPARAVDVWRETVNGDISGDRNVPSSAALVMGKNMLTATSSGPSASADREYITFSMPADSKLSQIYLDAWASTDQIGFIAVQNGTTFTEPPTGTNIANILGYDHFGPGAYPIGQNILSFMGMAPGTQGFTPPLPADNYTFWIQQTGATPITYTLGFLVVPEPSALVMLAIGGALACVSYYRRRPRR
jgi:hypothetical protein